ncbi:MAG TPA: hypothetical protein PLJ29_17830, partial [Leptospiraceae bacterium]|nr:hypothetical protein [Leptospiraceae bacterium]
MARKAIIYVEGRSEDILLNGKSFRDFFSEKNYSVETKNLKGKGNILQNYKKFLKLQGTQYHLTILLYDRDSSPMKNSDKPKENESEIFHEAIQEVEAWFLADHEEMKNIDGNYKNSNDTQNIESPKEKLIHIFQKAGKGFKNETSLAEHFKDRINLEEAQK